MRRSSRFISAFLMICLLAASLAAGCGASNDDGQKDNIVLNMPVGVTADYDYVAERNMYVVDVYSSSVNPVVTEYAFAKDQTFKRYGATPGESVKPGDVLAYSETKNLDKQIVDMQEEIADMESAHAMQVDGLNKDIYDARKAEYEAMLGYQEVAQFEPDEGSEAHKGWERMALMPEGALRRAVQNRERLEQNLKQTQELYELEHKYMLGNLNRISEKVDAATIISNVTGSVVACNYYSNGDYIPKETPILAVGDTTKRVLQTEYISKANISKALDIYAIIDGKRYELEYVNMDPEEYKQRSEAGESVFTTFILIDPSEEVQIGTYAAVVVEKDRRNNVVCVPNDAIKKEADGYYAYLYDGVESSYVPVQIGMRDGLYAEVISGLSVGDKVLSTQVAKKTANTAQVTRGDYSIEVEMNGFLFYPFSEWLTNPVQNQTTYLKEILVSTDESVEKDQVVATLEVIPDQIEIDRLNRQLARTQARLAKLKTEFADIVAANKVDRGKERQIAQYERDIALCNRQLSKLTKYTGIVEIKAPYAGFILEIAQIKPGDLLQNDSQIVEMANDSLSYVLVRDDKNQLNYGNEAEIRLPSVVDVSIPGKVVSVNKMCLSRELTNDFSIIAVPQEVMASEAGAAVAQGARWSRSGFKVKVRVRSEKNVLIVPKSAVTAKDKSTYVNVINEDGSVEKVSFIPGGSDNNYYWIVDGLAEGTTVCWE